MYHQPYLLAQKCIAPVWNDRTSASVETKEDKPSEGVDVISCSALKWNGISHHPKYDTSMQTDFYEPRCIECHFQPCSLRDREQGFVDWSNSIFHWSLSYIFFRHRWILEMHQLESTIPHVIPLLFSSSVRLFPHRTAWGRFWFEYSELVLAGKNGAPPEKMTCSFHSLEYQVHNSSE